MRFFNKVWKWLNSPMPSWSTWPAIILLHIIGSGGLFLIAWKIGGKW